MSQITSVSFRFQFWSKNSCSGLVVALCVVLLIGVSSEQAGRTQSSEASRGAVKSVSVKLEFWLIRKAQKRKVSTSRMCSVKCTVALKSATFEICPAWAGPVTVVWRTPEREEKPLKNSSWGAFMSAELYA